MPRFLLPFLLISFLSACGGDSGNPDIDGDGIANGVDAFPRDARESVDTDGDGVGDNSDDYPLDFDNDGVTDDADLFPEDPNESVDSDGDGIGDNSDPVYDINYEYVGIGNGAGSGFQEGVAQTSLGGADSLSAGGSVSVSVSIVDKSNESKEFLRLVSVYFTSTCVQIGLAEFTPSNLLASGNAVVTYRDKGCGKAYGATDNIVVYIGQEDEQGHITVEATARTTIDVAPKKASAIQFIEALPSIIALKGFGSEAHPSLSSASFKVLDFLGEPLVGHEVYFELEQEITGVSLLLNSALTDQEGKATVILSSGYVSGSLRVKAKVYQYDHDGNNTGSLSTRSTPITMANSLGGANNFTLSSNLLNPHAWDKTSTQINVVAHMGDYYHNPVLDGTTIYFRASGGLIDDSCETLAGSCLVNWSSVNPRPVDGVVTIFAYAPGQGDFQDSNANGLFDIGETFFSYGESWLDSNGNGLFDESGEYQPDLDIDDDGNMEFDWSVVSNFYEDFIDSNGNQEFNLFAGTKYQGINCSEEAKSQGHCAELMSVSASLRLQMSAGSDALIEGPFLMGENGEYDYSQTVSCIDGRLGQAKIAWRVADSQQRRNHVPMGTKITYQVDNVAVTSEKGTGQVPSTKPAAVLPVWEAISENAALTPAQRKEKYLNERGSLIELKITKPDDVAHDIEFGTINLVVETLDGIKRSPVSELRVDILGNTCPVP